MRTKRPVLAPPSSHPSPSPPPPLGAAPPLTTHYHPPAFDAVQTLVAGARLSSLPEIQSKHGGYMKVTGIRRVEWMEWEEGGVGGGCKVQRGILTVIYRASS